MCPCVFYGRVKPRPESECCGSDPCSNEVRHAAPRSLTSAHPPAEALAWPNSETDLTRKTKGGAARSGGEFVARPTGPNIAATSRSAATC